MISTGTSDLDARAAALAGVAAGTYVVPVVFVSGYAADDRDLLLDDRTLFVAKPYSIDTLRDALDSLLAG